jgi:2-keto-3-deoxy-L-rhamnonate aldolase RhmA
MFFRDRVRAGEKVVGTFMKTTSPQTIEVLAETALDFVVLDAEHAPFGIDSLSQVLGVAHALKLPTLVRIPGHDPAFINASLDLGAEGILVPHVRSAADADAIADAVKYGPGRRGFSPSSRAGGYGTLPASVYRSRADERSSIWCQIEDAEALGCVDEIAAHDAVDCVFIGPADLGWSLCPEGPDPEILERAIAGIIESARRHGRAVGIFVPSAAHIVEALRKRVSVIVSGSDQSLLMEGARHLSLALAERSQSESC